MPRRFLFLEVTDLAERLARVDGTEVEIVLFFNRGDATLEALVDADSVALHCTPAINLFPRRSDRVNVAEQAIYVVSGERVDLTGSAGAAAG